MRWITMTLLAGALLSGSQAFAQESLMDYVLDACKADMEAYCSQVTPGEGRLLYCAAAHEDKLSGECSYALYQASSLLEQMAAAIVYVATECKTDIETLCGDVKAGEGRILTCLKDRQPKVSEGCRTALESTVSE
ncbi:MAG: cysteine rich repeat-containing protein [Gammaproteobacteria bacterium]